jgi:hypothetical protein
LQPLLASVVALDPITVQKIYYCVFDLLVQIFQHFLLLVDFSQDGIFYNDGQIGLWRQKEGSAHRYERIMTAMYFEIDQAVVVEGILKKRVKS